MVTAGRLPRYCKVTKGAAASISLDGPAASPQLLARAPRDAFERAFDVKEKVKILLLAASGPLNVKVLYCAYPVASEVHVLATRKITSSGCRDTFADSRCARFGRAA